MRGLRPNGRRVGRPALRGALRAAVLAAVGGGVVAVSCADAQVHLRIAPLHTRWSYDETRGDVSGQQTYLALDAGWRTAPVTYSVGLDLVTARGESSAAAGNFDGLGDARVGVQSRWAGGALRLDARVETSLYEDGLSPNELRAAEVLEPFQLGFAVPRPGDGTRITTTAAWQLVRFAALHGQIGLSYQMRSGYDLREDGLSLDPGERLRVGTRWVRNVARVPVGAHLFVERFTASDLAGAEAFRLGSRMTVGLDTRVSMGDRSLALSLEALFAESGEVSTGTFLEAQALRGGNRWVAAASAPLWTATRMRIDGSLRARVHRGFAGSLGRSAWVTPGVRFTRSGLGGTVALALETSLGRVREGGTVRGMSAGLAWTGEFLR